MTTEEQKENAKVVLSGRFNNNGSYNDIKNIAIGYFKKEISNDSHFWHDLEDLIINLIEDHEE